MYWIQKGGKRGELDLEVALKRYRDVLLKDNKVLFGELTWKFSNWFLSTYEQYEYENDDEFFTDDEEIKFLRCCTSVEGKYYSDIMRGISNKTLHNICKKLVIDHIVEFISDMTDTYVTPNDIVLTEEVILKHRDIIATCLTTIFLGLSFCLYSEDEIKSWNVKQIENEYYSIVEDDVDLSKITLN